MGKYKQTDNVELRKLLEPAIVGAIQLLFGKNLIHRVHSTLITHTELEPEGDMFTINVVIEVHEKKEPAP